jgi:hypothetical protein
VEKDLLVRRGEQRHPGDLAAGWVEVAPGARLVCEGDLTCLGVVVDAGGAIECRDLVTNFLEVDNLGGKTRIQAKKIRARVVHTVQRALEEMIERGDVTADYWQHFGGDLNPSWDYARGKLSVKDAFYERNDDVPWVTFLLKEIRRALTAGESIFVDGVEPLVK